MSLHPKQKKKKLIIHHIADTAKPPLLSISELEAQDNCRSHTGKEKAQIPETLNWNRIHWNAVHNITHLFHELDNPVAGWF